MKKLMTVLTFTALTFCVSQNYGMARRNSDQVALDQQFLDAVSRGDLDQVKKTISSGADINAKNGSALYDAVFKNRPEIVKWLLDQKNIKVNSKIITNMYQAPLTMAIDWHPRFKGKITIHQARDQKNNQIIEYLLNHPEIDINIEDSSGGPSRKTPLIVAIENNDYEMVQRLLQHQKIDINKGVDGLYPLSYAIGLLSLDSINKETMLAIIKLLLKQKNIDVDVIIDYQDSMGKTDLETVIESNYIEIAILLLEKSTYDQKLKTLKLIASDNLLPVTLVPYLLSSLRIATSDLDFLVGKSAQTKLAQELQAIHLSAKKAKNKAFVRAMLDYYQKLRRLSSILPEDVIKETLLFAAPTSAI